EGMEHVANPTAARRSWPRGSSMPRLTSTGCTAVVLGATRRNQSNDPEQNDRPDESGEEADEEAAADDSENQGEEPAPTEPADDPQDQVSDHAVAMTAHHSPGQRTRDQPDQDEQDEVHGSLLLRMFTPASYSITWSARCSRDCGIVRPRALAVLRLMTSSNFVGCSTGRSAGLAPFRILSTYVALRPRRGANES